VPTPDTFTVPLACPEVGIVKLGPVNVSCPLATSAEAKQNTRRRLLVKILLITVLVLGN
jgi:hypothetical protein